MVGEVGTAVGTIMVVVGASAPPLVSASDLAYSGPQWPQLPTTVILTPTVTRILMGLRTRMGMLPRPLMVMAMRPTKEPVQKRSPSDRDIMSSGWIVACRLG